MFFLWGYNTWVPLSLPDTKQHSLLLCSIIGGHSPKWLVTVVVLWKGQWSCDVDRSVLSSSHSVRYEVQAGNTALSI